MNTALQTYAAETRTRFRAMQRLLMTVASHHACTLDHALVYKEKLLARACSQPQFQTMIASPGFAQVILLDEKPPVGNLEALSRVELLKDSRRLLIEHAAECSACFMSMAKYVHCAASLAEESLLTATRDVAHAVRGRRATRPELNELWFVNLVRAEGDRIGQKVVELERRLEGLPCRDPNIGALLVHASGPAIESHANLEVEGIHWYLLGAATQLRTRQTECVQVILHVSRDYCPRCGELYDFDEYHDRMIMEALTEAYRRAKHRLAN